MGNMQMPGNPRYQPKGLVPYFGYDRNAHFLVKVELAGLRTLHEIGVIPDADIAHLTPELEAQLLAITTSEMDIVEREVTKHDIRALVQIMQGRMQACPSLARWVHIPFTSFDVLDTARAVQYRDAHRGVIRPKVREVLALLAAKAKEHAKTLQIGRTHGQHALPITAGLWLATILSRLHVTAIAMNASVLALAGKASGAVGACNAQVGLGIDELCGDLTFEERVLERLGLPSIGCVLLSTQIVAPESLAFYLENVASATAVLGQFGRDCRNLMRSEIMEVGEPFAAGQVGSSTMAHKRNPINFENLEGMWERTKAELGKISSIRVSEHQRDLVGSSVMRDLPIIPINLCQQLDTLLRRKGSEPCFLEKISIDKESCLRNLRKEGDFILAEPMYIALQMAGYEGDAHHVVNHRAIPLAREKGISLHAAMSEHVVPSEPALQKAWESISPKVRSRFLLPEEYVGQSEKKTLELVELVCERLERSSGMNGDVPDLP